MALSDVFALITKYGKTRTFIRLVPGGQDVTASVKTMKRRAQEMPLMGEASQNAVQFFVRRGDLETASFPTPPKKGDRIQADDGTYTLNTVEEMHAQDGEPHGYRLWARGA